MVFDITKAIEKVGEAIKNGFSYAEKVKEKQSETAILKDRKNLQKAVDISEEIIEIMFKYLPLYLEQDVDDLQKLVKKFRKYN